MPRALDSIPSEVELCTSSVPGKLYGVRAVQKIPEGTWIGPYEGKHIRPNDITPEMDTSYMWEIFQDGKLVFYLDASDETQSSWMRYVCCARYKEEQNTSVMQYFGNIYYRVFKDIPPGEEILVWYDDSCPHYLGIPFKMQDIGLSSAVKSNVLSAPEAQPLNRLIRLTTTGSPPTTSISRPKLFSPSLTTQQQVEYPYQFPLPPVARQQTVLSGYPSNQLSNGHDVIIPSIIGHNSDQRLRKHVSTSPKTSLYGKSVLHSSYKKGSADTITTNSITHNPFISHRAKPYTRHNAFLRDVMKNQLRDTSFDQPKEAYLGDVVLDQTRDAPIDLSKKTFNHPNSKNVEQNGNHEYRMPEKDGYHRHNTLMASTDKTINKFLSQIEEARNEQQTKKQEFQESKKESNNSKQVELDVPSEICIWKCGQCEKSFAQQQILQLHICSNVPEKPYHCTYCSETFSQPSTLRTHAVIHSGKKPFKCGFCSRLFAGSTTLNNHIRTHTGERPFGCEKCGRAFSQASQLSRHRRTMFECM